MSLSHEYLAKKNFEQSAGACTPEWRVTMLFYAAVHAVSHVLFPSSHAPMTFKHKERGQKIFVHPKLRAVDSDYRELYGLSVTSRYMAANHPMSLAKVNRAFTLAVRVLSIAGISTSVATPASGARTADAGAGSAPAAGGAASSDAGQAGTS
ncbi:hypothetical protein [Sorangium sp. So ce381]|uniref:hypothetical protein n=1 Tax=Sorangium sp. So ce381 TaxID=3133307 RepID=UPI003F5AE5AF